MTTKTHKRPGRLQTPTSRESKTQQQFKAGCDINNIVKCYRSTGQTNFPVKGTPRSPKFGDLSNIPDLHTALSDLKRAQQDFYALPAKIRAEFGNNPENLLRFLSDDSNRDRAIELGLIDAPEVDTPIDVHIKSSDLEEKIAEIDSKKAKAEEK